jgi:hypothetical protein
MSEPDWPPNGLLLAAAIEHLLDPAALDRDASNLLATVVDVRTVLAGEGSRAELIAAGQRARAAVAAERFKALMLEGQYRAQGRRGSPTADFSKIPNSAWPRLDLDAAASQVIERVAGGATWFDVHILPPTAAPGPAPPSVSEQSSAAPATLKTFRSVEDWVFYACATIEQEEDELDAAYVRRITELGRGRVEGFDDLKPRTVSNCFYRYRKLKH